ncbi:GWxTD domain-containing protein [bacterium]|nr:GWxTD domain-containing protein [bacterium]
MRFRSFLLALVLFNSYDVLASESEPNLDKYYNQGLEYKKSGDWNKALQAWLTGSQQLQRAGRSNPQIGFAFIELVAEMQVRKAYSLANQIYFWGLSGGESFDHGREIKEALEKEIDRIAPLMEDRDAATLKRLLKKRDPSFFDQIKQFWQERDPTPSTTLNERLLEHWERIAYARKNYNMANTTPYQTDDRGLIYVKYGRPDRVKSGLLGTNRAKMKRWSAVIQGLHSGPDVVDARTTARQAASNTFLLETIDRYNHSPEYEVWQYYQESPDDHPVFFLFGSREGMGSFGLRDGVEDFIPRSAFTQGSTIYTNGVLPGAVLQALYYSELSRVHPYFEDRYYDLESQWDSLDKDGASAIMRFNTMVRSKRRLYEGIDKVYIANVYTPPDESNFDEMVSAVDVVLYPFRFLDDQRGSMIAVLAFSFPKIKGKFLDKRSEQLLPRYSLAHTLLVQDAREREILRHQDLIPSGQGNLSSFMIAHAPNYKEYKIISEVFAPQTHNSDLADSTVSDNSQAIGIGRRSLLTKKPLSSSKNALELSDLIIGVDVPNQAPISDLPFPVIPSPRIRAGDLVKIYLEVYHLDLDAEGMAHFTIDFEAAKLRGKKKSKKETISLSFNFDSPTSTSKESFQIDTSKLTAGSYELLVNVKDTISGKTKQRKEVFEVGK